MVTEFLINLVWYIVKPMVDLIPAMEIDIAPDTFDYFFQLAGGVFYLLPMVDIMLIFGTVIFLNTVRILVAFLKSLWGILPIV